MVYVYYFSIPCFFGQIKLDLYFCYAFLLLRSGFWLFPDQVKVCTDCFDISLIIILFADYLVEDSDRYLFLLDLVEGIRHLSH